jgi:hypothetical protein
MTVKKAVKTTLKGLAALEAPAALKRAKAALANAPVTAKELKRIAFEAADRAAAEAPAKAERRGFKAAMKLSRQKDKAARKSGVFQMQKTEGGAGKRPGPFTGEATWRAEDKKAAGE